MAARRLFTALLAFLLSASVQASSRRRTVDRPLAWNAAISLETRLAQVIGSRTIESSSTLLARWVAPAGTVDHFILTATETAGGPPLQFTATALETSKILDRLESATEYRVSIAACLDTACARSITTSSPATATTDEEYWQIRGTGSSYATADHVVADGNTKGYALVWGSDAGASLAGHAQFYYDPSAPTEKGIKLATSNASVTSSADSVATFNAISGNVFRRSDGQGHAGIGPLTFQIVPLSQRLGGNIRLFYEAEDGKGAGRVYSIDSVDGWLGRDFNSGSSTLCLESDIAPGAPCGAKMLVGVETDGNPKVKQARQLKLGLPTLEKWTWDSEVGTFMVVTIHLTDTTCSSTFFNLGYAVWDGAKWNLQYDAGGCPKLIPGVQAPMPVHIGGTRYKLHFNHNTTGSQTQKPMRLLYADGSASGSPSIVDFEDWESISRARRVNFVWPTGTLLNELETSMLDDYHVLMPTNDPSFQVIYSNMSCPNNACGAPFIGMAVLLNP